MTADDVIWTEAHRWRAPPDEQHGSGQAPDTFTALAATVQTLTRRFPDHYGPFARVSRQAEESGEPAAAINHTEGTGIKVSKQGPSDPVPLVKEVMDVLRAAVGIAAHHDVVDDLRAAITDHYLRHVRLGWIEVPQPEPGAKQHDDH